MYFILYAILNGTVKNLIFNCSFQVYRNIFEFCTVTFSYILAKTSFQTPKDFPHTGSCCVSNGSLLTSLCICVGQWLISNVFLTLGLTSFKSGSLTRLGCSANELQESACPWLSPQPWVNDVLHDTWAS